MDYEARSNMKNLLAPVMKQQHIIAFEQDEGFDSISQIDNHVFITLRSTHKGKPNKLGSLAGPRIR